MSARHRQRPMFVPPPEGDALSHGLAMVAVPTVFGLIGAFVDSRVGTGPVLLLAFALFGLACSFASAYYRYSQRMAAQQEGKPWARRQSTRGEVA